jgi:hypothetical protein
MVMILSQEAIKIEVHGIGVGKAQGVLKRYLAPLTVGRILRELRKAPIAGPAMKRPDVPGQISLQTKVIAGKEKAVQQVEAGDMAYMPQTASICIFTETMKPYEPVNKIGLIIEGLEFLEQLRTGNTLSIKLEK